MRNTRPKIVVVGAASASFGLSNLGAILRTPALQGSTLALCDLNEPGLQEIRRLADRINEEWGAGATIESSTALRSLLPGADFVILSVAIDREACWLSDFELGKKYGLIHYAENGGPGGFFHAARNITLVKPVLSDIESIAPGATVLNFTNPMSRICTAAVRETSLRVVGICHQIEFGYLMAGRILGRDLGLSINHDFLFRWNRDPEQVRIATQAHQRLDIQAAGLNHFTWFLSIRDRQTGEELLPRFLELFLAQSEFEPYTRDFIDTFGVCPVSGDAHFLEYLPYTGNMNRDAWQRYDIQMYPLAGQAANRETMWREIADMAHGRASIDPLRDRHTERAENMIAALWDGTDECDPAVNIPNTYGLIGNLPRDAVVEVPAQLGLHGIRGLAIGDLPRVPAALCQRQLDITEMAVRSILDGDRKLALQALALDPMIDDLDVARRLLDEGLAVNARYLPQFN